ncbi:MAG: hypothetical protein R3D88_09220 [Alphaproteobacteria bacterium]|nr:hypothetical protein [Alphaproteobacteria bacterium]
MIKTASSASSQKGSVFFYILIAIVLLAALSYAVSRGSRVGSNTITEQQSQVIASEILEQAEAVTLAVQKLLLRGFDETEISFENSAVAGYTLASCSTDDCKVFALSGGSLNWFTPPQGANNGEDWVYTGNLPILGNGSQNYYDITMILPNINEQICRQLNVNSNVVTNLNDPIPVANDTTLLANKLTTATPIATSPNFIDGANIDNHDAVCVQIVGSSGEFAAIPANAYFFVKTIYAG